MDTFIPKVRVSHLIIIPKWSLSRVESVSYSVPIALMISTTICYGTLLGYFVRSTGVSQCPKKLPQAIFTPLLLTTSV